jgi:hypothetical protein
MVEGYCARYPLPPEAANTAHLLSPAVVWLHAADHFGYSDAARPWAADRHCALCLTEVAETIPHILTSYPVAFAVWQNTFTLLAPRTLEELVCPPSVPPDHILRKRLRFIHEIWRGQNQRRFGHQEPCPLDLPSLSIRNI